MFYFRNKSSVKSFFVYLVIAGMFMGLCGCGTGSAFTRKENEYFKFYQELHNDRKTLIKGKTLCDVEPSFWEGSGTVNVSVPRTKIIAIAVGDIDFFETAKGGVASGIGSLVMSGINPIGLLGSAVGTAAGLLFSGPARGSDPAFQGAIDKFVNSYDWKMDEYFFQVVKKDTKLSLARETADDLLFDRFGERAEKETGGKNVIMFLNLRIMPSRMEGWLEPKYRLLASTGITVATDEAVEAFKNKFSKDPFYAQMYMDKKAAGTELRRVPSFPGMYMGSVYKNSPYYAKKEWLSGKGVFLEKELKSALTYMAQEADKLFFPVKE